MVAGNKGGRPKGDHHQYVTDLGPLDSNGRRPCTCAFCPYEYESMRPEQVWEHAIHHCKNISGECKAQAIDQVAAKTTKLQAPAVKRSRTDSQSVKTAASTQSSLSLPSVRAVTPSSGTVTPQAQRELDTLFLRALVHAGVPFNVAEDPFVIDLLQQLRPKWNVPGKPILKLRAL